MGMVGDWAQSAVAKVLSNPLYIGKIRHRVGDDWQLYDGRHEPIVDADLWHRVNRSRATSERRAGGRPLASSHLLTRGLGNQQINFGVPVVAGCQAGRRPLGADELRHLL